MKLEETTVVFTIGHSTRAIEEFIGLLQAHAVSRVVDVRTVPRSRHNPQFNQDSLPDSLKEAGLSYVHTPGLGGRVIFFRNSRSQIAHYLNEWTRNRLMKHADWRG